MIYEYTGTWTLWVVFSIPQPQCQEYAECTHYWQLWRAGFRVVSGVSLHSLEVQVSAILRIVYSGGHSHLGSPS